MAASGQPEKAVVSVERLSKSYGAVAAVRGVDLELRAGEVLALVGDNGAGKTTLVKMLAGAVSPTSGAIKLDGEPISFGNPGDARRAGIETVWQSLGLVEELDVCGNLFLGREPVFGRLPRLVGVIKARAMRAAAAQHLAELEAGVLVGHLRTRVAGLSGGQRQIIAIARAVTWASRVIFLDEPTAALGVRQSAAVLRVIEQTAARGMAVVVVTHTIPHVLEVADRVVVMSHGRKVGDLLRKDVTAERLVGLMTGAVGSQDESRMTDTAAGNHLTEE